MEKPVRQIEYQTTHIKIYVTLDLAASERMSQNKTKNHTP